MTAPGAHHPERLPRRPHEPQRCPRPRVEGESAEASSAGGRVSPRRARGRPRRRAASSSCSGSERVIVIIQPAPYGSWLTSSGVSVERVVHRRDRARDRARRCRTPTSSTRSRDTLAPATTSMPTSGSCTNTTSPRLSCAKSVMPTRREVRRRRGPTRAPRCTEDRQECSWPGIVVTRVSSATWPAWIATSRRASASLAPSAHTCVTGELGVGQHERPAVGVDDLHAVDEHDVGCPSPARSRRASPRPCVPTASARLRARCAVRRSRRRPPTTAGRSPRAGRAGAPASRPRRTRAGTSGQMKPPSCDAAKSTAPLLATSIRCAAESFVHTIDAPCRVRDALGFAAHRRPAARCGRRAVLGTRAHEHEQRLFRRERGALVVDDRRGLAVGSNTNPRSEPDVRTRSPIVFSRVSRSSPAGDARGRRVRVDRRARSPRSWRARSASRSTPRRTSSRARP